MLSLADELIRSHDISNQAQSGPWEHSQRQKSQQWAGDSATGVTYKKLKEVQKSY